MKKIFITTTFREFNGSKNEQIQRLFIESLKRQTYKNWEMVITIFNEQKVEKEIKKYNIPCRFYYNSSVGYRFSLTDVLLNCIDYIEALKEGIIIWTTCDIILEEDFFMNIIKNYSKGFFGTLHPHLIYKGINSYNSRNFQKPSINSGIDMLFTDSSLFLKDDVKKLIKNYKFIDWGLFEHFMVGVGVVFSKKMINLYMLNKLHKIINDRQVGNETNEYLVKSWNRNKLVLDNFIKDYKSNSLLFDLVYCHKQFEIVGDKLSYYKEFVLDFLRYYQRNIRKKVFLLIPKGIKKILKKVIK